MKATLYRYFDADGRLLYVGISQTFLKRQAEHRHKSEWYYEAASATFQHFDDRESAAAAETAAIESEAPLYNIQQRSYSAPESKEIKKARAEAEAELKRNYELEQLQRELQHAHQSLARADQELEDYKYREIHFIDFINFLKSRQDTQNAD